MTNDMQYFSKQICYKFKNKPILIIIYIFLLLSILIINYNILELLAILSPILIYSFFNFPEVNIIFMFTYGYIFPAGANRFLTGVFLLIALSGMFYEIIKNKHNIFKINKITRDNLIIFTIFTFWLFIRSITSGNIINSLDKFSSFMLLVVIVYYYFGFIPLNYNRFKKILYVLFTTILLMSILALVNFIGADKSDVRFTANGQNVIGFSRYLVIMTIMIVTLAFNKNHILNRKTAIVFSLTSFLLVILTNTKGALLSLILSIILTLLTVGKRAQLRKNLYKILIVILILILILIILPNKYTHRYVNIGEVFSRGSFHSRISLYSQAITSWLNNPLVGVGFGNYKFVNLEGYTYPHNIFLEILSETGIIGITLFILLIINILFNIEKQIKEYNNDKNKIYIIMLKTSFIALLISAQFSGNIYGNSILFLIGALSIKFSNYTNINVKNNINLKEGSNYEFK